MIIKAIFYLKLCSKNHLGNSPLNGEFMDESTPTIETHFSAPLDPASEVSAE
jgi:hypothetical protein